MNVKRFNNEIDALANAQGYTISGDMILSKTRGPKVLITSGIHGDELAGPFAIYTFIKRHKAELPVNITFMPLLNKHGLRHNEREDRLGRDLNRGFNKKLDNNHIDPLKEYINIHDPDLVVNLHEDKTHDGCYIYVAYEEMRDDALEILESMSRYTKVYTGEKVFGDDCEAGVILQSKAQKRPKNQNSFEYFCYLKNIPYMTIETPGKEDLKNRCAAMVRALETIIGLK